MKKQHLEIKFHRAFKYCDEDVYEYVVSAKFPLRNESYRRFKKRCTNEVRRRINEIPSHLIPDLATSRLYALCTTQPPVEYVHQFNQNVPRIIRNELYRRLKKMSVDNSILCRARNLKRVRIQEPELTELIMQYISLKEFNL